MKTAVEVRRDGHLVTYHKNGSKASLCKVTKITIRGKTFMGRRGGRTLCGPTKVERDGKKYTLNGKLSADAKAARAAFKRMVYSGKRRRSHSRRRGRR